MGHLGSSRGGLQASWELLGWFGAALGAALGAPGCSLEVLGCSLGGCCGTRGFLGRAISYMEVLEDFGKTNLKKSNLEVLGGSWGGCCGSWELFGGAISYMEALEDFCKNKLEKVKLGGSWRFLGVLLWLLGALGGSNFLHGNPGVLLQ